MRNGKHSLTFWPIAASQADPAPPLSQTTYAAFLPSQLAEAIFETSADTNSVEKRVRAFAIAIACIVSYLRLPGLNSVRAKVQELIGRICRLGGVRWSCRFTFGGCSTSLDGQCSSGWEPTGSSKSFTSSTSKRLAKPGPLRHQALSSG